MDNHASTLATWAGAIATTLELRGFNSREIFQQAGLDIEQTLDANARYPVTAMAVLWRTCASVTLDPAFGLSVPENRGSTTFHGTGLAIDASATLREKLQRLIKLSRLVSTVAEVQLNQREDGHWLLNWHIEPQHRKVVADEAMDAFLASNVDKLNPEDLIEVFLIRDEPADPQPWHDKFFHRPVHFGADSDAVVYAKESLDKPLKGSNPALARMGESVALDHLQKMERLDVVLNVSNEIRKALGNGEPKQQDIANLLNLSVRQLQRKLTEKDTSFSKLVQNARHTQAKEYLRDLTLPIITISLNLGFSDASNFSSAFKRWEGISPKVFRNQCKAPSAGTADEKE